MPQCIPLNGFGYSRSQRLTRQQTRSIGFKSGNWDDQFIVALPVEVSQLFVALDACLASLCCWKIAFLSLLSRLGPNKWSEWLLAILNPPCQSHNLSHLHQVRTYSPKLSDCRCQNLSVSWMISAQKLFGSLDQAYLILSLLILLGLVSSDQMMLFKCSRYQFFTF